MDVPPTPVEGLPAGTRFGPWVCVRPLAAGGMAELYLAAHHENPLRPLAVVKRLLPHLSWDPEFVAMFLAEVRIAAGLDHPNVVHVFDFGVGQGGHYFAMEYLHGRDLRSVLHDASQLGPLPLDLALGIVLQVGEGLAYAHGFVDPHGRRLEVVHRDVSPSNVLMCFDGRVKLVDFGIAHVTAQTRHTRAGTVKGKVGYMSPEQCRGDVVDRRSDVFGLGILLYELTAGRRAFFGDNEFAVMNRVVDGAFVRPSSIMPTYPAPLEAIIERALAPDPADRFATADAMIDALRAFVSTAGLDVGPTPRQRWLEARFGRPPLPVVDPDTIARAMPPSRPWILRGALLGGIAVAVGIAGFVLGGRMRDGSPTAPIDPESTPAAIAIPIATPTVVPDPAPSPAELAADEVIAIDEDEDEEAFDPGVDSETSEELAGSSPARKRARPRRSGRRDSTSTRPTGEDLLPPSRRNR